MSYTVDSTCNDMRLDRWLRNKIGKIPQGLIEKNLRLGKIKVNKNKIKSSFKVKTGDKISIFNLVLSFWLLKKTKIIINNVVNIGIDLIK